MSNNNGFDKYLKAPDSDWFKGRLAIITYLFISAFIVLLIRLFILQIVEGHEYRRLSENNCIRLQDIAPLRGLIFDRNGTVLVDNRPSFDLNIVRKDAEPVSTTLSKLSAYSRISLDDLKLQLNRYRGYPSYRPIPLMRDVGRDLLAVIEARRYDLPGIVVAVKPRRHYIFNSTAAHVLGYLSEINPQELKCDAYSGCKPGDYVGKFGVEKNFEHYLRGKRGGRQVEVNAKGQTVRVLRTVDAIPGNNIYLTIDLALQKKAESLLEGKSGAVVAVRTDTGEVLASASSPNFDQNAFVKGMTVSAWNELVSNPYRPMRNKVIQGQYPPGSTYKIITAIAGLEEKVIDVNTIINCPGWHRFGNRVYRCWKRGGHGNMNVVSSLEESCDVFFYQTGHRLGVDTLARYAEACGLGHRTGIPLSHEEKGLVPTSEWKKRRYNVPWMAGETLSVAIGQSYNLATPIQMAILVAAVANGGIRYKPQLVKSVENAEGETIFKCVPEEVGRIPVSENTLKIVRKGLFKAVNSNRGTAKIIRGDDVLISGKTGTSQVIGRKKNETDDKDDDKPTHLLPHAWFIAYAPSENPKIAVAVIIEHGEHGSSAAAPVAGELIRYYLTEL